MTLTRWKLLAGVFGLSLCGLAALGEPTKTKSTYQHRGEPTPVAQAPVVTGSTNLPPVTLPAVPTFTVAAPPAQMPTLPQAVVSQAPTTVIPEITLPAAPAPVPGIPLSGVNLPRTGFKLEDGRTVVTQQVVPPVYTPGIPTNPPASTAVSPPDLAPPKIPEAAPPKVVDVPVIQLPETKPQDFSGTLMTPEQFIREFGVQFGTIDGNKTPDKLIIPTVAETPKPMPTPVVTAPVVPQATVPAPVVATPVVTTPPVVPTPTPMPTPAPVVTSDKKLKVTLSLGDGQPKFEVRDGEEVVLKVISDGVEVRTPADRTDGFSVLKAVKRVKFTSPGGDGYCDELQLIPGTGEVLATGNVQFQYHWGKVQTAVTSDKMTFRLGANGTVSILNATKPAPVTAETPVSTTTR